MAEFKDSDDFEDWLNALPEDRRLVAARLLSLRAALRVLPLTLLVRDADFGAKAKKSLVNELLIASLRAPSLALAISLVPAKAKEFATAAASAATAAASAARAATASRAARAASAATAAASAARAATASRAARAARAATAAASAAAEAAGFAARAAFASRAARAATAAASAATAAASAAAEAAGFAARAATAADASWLEQNWQNAGTLLNQPIWPEGAPEWALRDARYFTGSLIAAGDDWDVWVRWYQARWQGVPPDPDYILAIARIPNEEWDKGPPHVNAIIKRLEEEAERRKRLQPLLSLADDRFLPWALGVRFEVKGTVLVISHQVNESDLAAIQSPVVRQLHESVRDKAAKFAKSCERIEHLEGWHQLPEAALNFAEAVNRSLSVVASSIATVWERTVELGTFFEQVGRIAADPRTNMPNLPHDLVRELEGLIRIAAPWVRKFPTAEALDDDAGAFLARTDLFNSANALFDLALKRQLITDEDRALLRNLYDALQRGEFQGKKAGNRLVGSAKNLLIAVAGFYAGMIGNNAAPESIIATKGAEVILELEAQALDLIENPPDLHAAIRAMINDIKANMETAKQQKPLPPHIDGEMR